MKDFLHHLLLPRESNNQRAKLLHHSSVFVVIVFLFIAEFFINNVSHKYPSVLGVAANISSQDLLALTNQKRQENGQPPLIMSTALNNAASMKATDMFAKNYWAHNAPDGTTPWVFIKSSGYEYIYAGENLARGFTTAPDVVNAWMESPSHRENLLSPNYKEIGFAVKDGSLTGDETVLVVQMFGSQAKSPITQEISSTTNQVAQTVPLPVTPIPSVSQNPITRIAQSFATHKIAPQKGTESPQLVASFMSEPLVDKNVFSKNLSIVIVTLFISVIFIDIVIIKRRKIVRLISHNIDQVIFFIIILLTVLIIRGGRIL